MPTALRSLPPPAKKRKIDKKQATESIRTLEETLTQAAATKTSLNALADLIKLTVNSREPQDTFKAVYATYRVFVILISGDKLALGGDDAAKAVKAWILDRLAEFVDFLCTLLQDDEKLLRISALQILFSLQKHLSTSYTKHSGPSTPPQFHRSHFRKIAQALLLCPPSSRSKTSKPAIIDPDVLDAFYDTWFSVHDDIRWFFLRECVGLLNNHSQDEYPDLSTNILSVLERLSTFPTEQSELNAWWVEEMGKKPARTKGGLSASVEENENNAGDPGEEDDDWRKFFDEEPHVTDTKAFGAGARLHTLTIHQSLHSLASHRAVFTRAWLTLLPRLTRPEDLVQSQELALRALTIMHRGVMPNLSRPILVMDWVGSCVDFGGTVGLLALNALFVLMKDYNLDYPSFYTRLYAFLDRDVLHLKHRSRFFRMTELFLSSTHLPATLLASFIKRLSRLSLSAPPSAIIMLIPFTYNTLKRHPALMQMIHRVDDANSEFSDPFLPHETNPLSTQALSSSLWELNSHTTHYHSAVSSLAKIFSEAFTKPGYAIEDFLDHTYNTLFDTDIKRKIKKEPALAVENGPAVDLFPCGVLEEGGSDEANLVGDRASGLWVFT